MLPAIIAPILGIVQEGLKFLNEKEQNKFLEEYNDVLTALAKAQNATGEDYFDSDIDFASERVRICLEAFGTKLREARMATVQPKNP